MPANLQPLKAGLFLALSSALLLSGCAQLSGPSSAHTTVPAPAAEAGGYGWEGNVLEATGRAEAPEGTAAFQRSLVARNGARVAALKSLGQQVRALPVGSDLTIGSVMDTYLNVRRAVEKEVQKAEEVSERPDGSRGFEVQVRLPLAPIADILKQNHISPTEELPKPPSRGDETGVAPIT